MSSRAVVVCVVGLGSLAAPSVARAEPKIELEARGELLFGDDPFGNEIFGGPGLGVTFGYALDTYPILVVPELALTGAYYPDEAFGSARATAGIRAGLTTIVEPSVYAHFGYGALPTELAVGHTFTLDAGVTVDKRLSRGLTIGGSRGYQGFVGDVDAHGLTGGFHVGFWL
jgi:hypothetical protein